MRPAFTRRGDALLFTVLLAVVLAFPASPWWPGPEGRFWPPLPLLNNVTIVRGILFGPPRDYDIVLSGASALWNDVDPDILREEFVKAGLPAPRVVYVPYEGFWPEVRYGLLETFFQRHTARLVLLNEEIYPAWGASQGPYVLSPRDPVLTGLPAAQRGALYGAAVVAGSRVAFENLTTPRPGKGWWWATGPLGFWSSRQGYGGTAFEEWAGWHPEVPVSEILHVKEPETPPTALPMPTSAHFRRRTEELITAHGGTFAYVTTPWFYHRRLDLLNERTDVAYPPEHPFLGVAPARLFAGMTDEDIKRVYRDDGHLNANGSAVFTRLLAPAILQLWKEATHAGAR